MNPYIANSADKLPYTHPLTPDYFLRIYSSFRSIHQWRYSPFWALASHGRRLHSSLSSVRLLHPRIPRICGVSLQTTSSHLALGFPTGLVLWNFPLRTFFGILSSSSVTIWPAHPNLSASYVRNSACSTKHGCSSLYLQGCIRKQRYLALQPSPCFFRFNLILYSKSSLSFSLSTKFLYISRFFHACYMPHPSHFI